jgi:hypothetical protein
VVFAYHIAYSDNNGHVIVDLTAPTGERSPRTSALDKQTSIWTRLKRIRMQSDEAVSEVTLANGKTVRVDARTFGSLIKGVQFQAIASGSAAVSPETRARQLQSMIAPLIRIRTQSSLKLPGLMTADAKDSSDTNRSDWSALSESFDVARRREFNRPSGLSGSMRRMTMEITNSHLAGIPSKLR